MQTSTPQVTDFGVLPAFDAPGIATGEARSAGKLASVSNAEKQYISDGVEQRLRTDGRTLLDHRPWSAATGVLAHCDGSARISTADCDCLVGVKAEVERVPYGSDGGGAVVCTVDASPVAEMCSRDVGQMNNQLALLLERLVLSNIQKEALVLVPGLLMWKIYVDIIIVAGRGDPLDACGRGIVAAFLDARLPAITLVQQEEDGAQVMDYRVDPRPEEATPIPGLELLPLCVTVAQVGGHFVWDPSVDEEAVADVLLVVAVRADGTPIGMEKRGRRSLPLGLLPMALANAHVVGEALHSDLREKIARKGDAEGGR